MNALRIAAQSTTSKFSDLVADRLFTSTDARLDRIMTTINTFREFGLYKAPSEVPLDALDAIAEAFQAAAQANTNASGFKGAVSFNWAVMQARARYAKQLVKMEQGIATYYLYSAMFRLG